MNVSLDLQINELKPHPLNVKIYGANVDVDDLLKSVETHGIITPLLITHKKVIISGHRRWIVAQKLGLERVPCMQSDLTEDLDIEEAIIHANKQREKTNEQKAREFEELKRIEEEKAEIRKLSKLRRGNEKAESEKTNDNALPPDPLNLADRENIGEARDIAAKKVGMSHSTAEKALKVVHAADQLRDDGKEEEADELLETLNEASVNKAYNEIKGDTKPQKKDSRGAVPYTPSVEQDWEDFKEKMKWIGEYICRLADQEIEINASCPILRNLIDVEKLLERQLKITTEIIENLSEEAY